MTKKKAKIQLIILSIVILLLTVAIVMPKGTQIFNSDYDYNGLWHDIKLGIDLKGGVYAVYNVEKNSDGDEVTDSAVAGTVDRLTRVLFNRGYTEATVVEQSSLGGTRQIRVEVPDVEDPQSLFDLLGRPALLEFKDPDNLDTVYVTGQNVTEAYAGYSGTDPVVVLKFDADGTTAFRDATTAKVGSSIGIYVNGTLIAKPTVNEAITTGEATITGVGDYAACQELALQIQGGSFPVKLVSVESNVISASLGDNAIVMSLLAGLIGFLLIIGFMILMYKRLGGAAAIALLSYIVLTFVLLSIVPWVQLTISGIGGIVLGIGMAVDANIVIFERIKDEYEKGKPMPAAVAMGFKRAGRAILDSNITTIIGAVALYVFGPASLRSFAITLSISIILSVFTALVLTRRIIKLFLALDNKKAKAYGLRTAAEGQSKLRKFVETVKTKPVTEKKKIWFLIPAAVVAISILVFGIMGGINKSFWKGIDLGIDFTGGSILTVNFDGIDEINLSDNATYIAERDRISGIIGEKGYEVNLVQRSSDTLLYIRFQNTQNTADNEEIAAAVLEYYSDLYGDKFQPTDASTTFISATSSADLLAKAASAVAIALLATLLYIAIRFKWRYAIAAVIKLVHDVILMIAAMIIIGHIFSVSVNSAFIAALVTIVGYAINDVIVIFDRVRENITFLENKNKFNVNEVANRSIGETLTRSFYTTLTTFATILFLALLGENSMREFAVPVIAGLVIGFYSSVFVAPSLWVIFVKDGMKRASEKKLNAIGNSVDRKAYDEELVVLTPVTETGIAAPQAFAKPKQEKKPYVSAVKTFKRKK